MKTLRMVLFCTALSADVALSQQTASAQPGQPAPQTPDAQIQALQEKIKALQLQGQIDALQKQAQALQQPKPALPPCEAAAAPKPNGWVDRMKRKAEAIAAKQAANAGNKIAQKTGGAIDGSVIPTVQDIPASQPKPCAPVGSATPVNGQSK